ncbi:MAG: hypothetical protein R3E66_24065 [bacterium]
MTTDFVIIGGGCYGTYYVRQLLQARDRGKLTWSKVLVLDRDRSCAVAQLNHPDVTVEVTQWEAWGAQLVRRRAELEGGQLVPAPIAPHILKHWLLDAWTREGRVTDVAYPSCPTELPYAAVLERGTLVLSHAPGMCPVNCIEPRKCPLTRAERDWEMGDTVAHLAAREGLPVEVFACRHYAYGVGTIGFSDIFAALSRMPEHAAVGRVAIATVSACHGLVDVVDIHHS